MLWSNALVAPCPRLIAKVPYCTLGISRQGYLPKYPTSLYPTCVSRSLKGLEICSGLSCSHQTPGGAPLSLAYLTTFHLTWVPARLFNSPPPPHFHSRLPAVLHPSSALLAQVALANPSSGSTAARNC